MTISDAPAGPGGGVVVYRLREFFDITRMST